MAQSEKHFDLLVVGSGAAGLSAALRAAELGASVGILTAGALLAGSSPRAQGGVAAAVGVDDAPALHAADTLAVGAGLNDASAVDVLTREGSRSVRQLWDDGVPFEDDLGLEAGHARRRILHAGGGATGQVLTSALLERAIENPRIALLDHSPVSALVMERGGAHIGPEADHADRVVGVRSVNNVFGAQGVVLATGGYAALWGRSTNAPESRGTGLALAWQAGAALADLEFVQFHPTALAAPGTPLISEAVRGEGALLVDELGERFMLEVDPRAELAPRDVVARAVWRRMWEQGAPVLLDATGLGARRLSTRFPGLDAACRDAGYDWSSEPVPITPAAHYAMGGVIADLDGRTSLPGLFAVGETARTGVHGANRLASNSLLEAAVFADRTARALGSAIRGLRSREAASRNPAAAMPGFETGAARPPHPADTGPEIVDRAALQELMWTHVGLERDAAGLAAASARLAAWRAPDVRDRRTAEDRNLLDLARLTVAAAHARRESVGAHYRADSPTTARLATPEQEAA
jgi:L-aspartate oxidase